MLDSSSVFSNYLANLEKTDSKLKGVSSKKRETEEEVKIDNPLSKMGDSECDPEDEFPPDAGYANLVQRQDSVTTQEKPTIKGLPSQGQGLYSDNDIVPRNGAVLRPQGSAPIGTANMVGMRFATDEEEGISAKTKKRDYRSDLKRMSTDAHLEK